MVLCPSYLVAVNHFGYIARLPIKFSAIWSYFCFKMTIVLVLISRSATNALLHYIVQTGMQVGIKSKPLGLFEIDPGYVR